MKRIIAILLGGLLLLATVHTAFAWEFSMKGEFEYRYRFFERMGKKDLYGDLRFQDSGTYADDRPIGFAGPMFYELGSVHSIASANAEFAAGFNNNFITRGGFSTYGSDARVTDMRLTLYPTLKVNSAIEIYLALNIGGFRNKYAMWRNDGAYTIGFDPASGATNLAGLNYSAGVPPLERYYMSQSSDAATNTASLISVDEFKFAFQLPLGFFSFGTKNFPLGTGATFARNTREESVYIAVPYGPFLVRGYLFPTEPPRITNPGAHTTGGLTERFALDNIAGWGTGPDGEVISRRYLGGVIQYLAGEMEAGMGAFNRKQHLPRGYIDRLYASVTATASLPSLNVSFSATVTDRPRYTLDRESWVALAWFKFNNGRFFFNGEAALSDYETNISDFNGFFVTDLWPKYESRSNHFFVETGIYAGPSKLSVMYAHSSGRVLSNRFYTDQAFRFGYYTTRPNPSQWWDIFQINYQVLEPYNLLMFNTYGGGNGIVNPDGTGELGDARAIAVRLDYAVAANLNVFASLMYAKRLERHGYYAGTFGTRNELLGLGTSGNFWPHGGSALNSASEWKAGNGYSGANPWINDDFIGWEAGAGVQWQLLEGLTWEGRYAYWSVGPWFDMAYKAYNGSRVGGNTGNNLMVGRDPIQAITMSLKVNF